MASLSSSAMRFPISVITASGLPFIILQKATLCYHELSINPRGYGMPIYLEPKVPTSMIMTQSTMTNSDAICTCLDSHSMRFQVTRRDAQASALLSNTPLALISTARRRSPKEELDCVLFLQMSRAERAAP